MPRQMPTTLRPRILALKPAEEASSSHSKSAAVVPDVNTPSRTVRPPFRLFDPFSAGLGQFQPAAFMAPVRTSVATEFNSGEHTYGTIKPHLPSIRNMMPMVPWGFILTQRRVTAPCGWPQPVGTRPSRAEREPRGAEYAEVFRLDFSHAERVDRVEAW